MICLQYSIIVVFKTFIPNTSLTVFSLPFINSIMAKQSYDRHSKRDGKKHPTKGGKGGKIQADGSFHRSTGTLCTEYYTPTKVSKDEFHACPHADDVEHE